MLFKWTPNFVPRKIFIFGCGGTGSRVVPLVAQFVKSCAWVINPEIHLFDFDEVETKNLLRQNFISSDVGKNKAIVLANRYAKAFNVSIVPHTARLTKSPSTTAERALYEEINNLVYAESRTNCLYIMCVDSPEARREIAGTILYISGSNMGNLIIDAGNENDFGQVTLSSTLGMTSDSYIGGLRDNTPVQCDIPFIPVDSGYYDNMVATATPSCADLDQTMAINTLMAVNIFGIIQNIYYVKPINFFRINISMQHGAAPQYMNTDYFKKVHTKQASAVSSLRSVESNLLRSSIYRNMAKAYADQEEFDILMKKAQNPEPESKGVNASSSDKAGKSVRRKKNEIAEAIPIEIAESILVGATEAAGINMSIATQIINERMTDRIS